MTHPLHQYLCQQLGKKIQDRRLVVFYDPRSEFLPFFDHELSEVDSGDSDLPRVALGEHQVFLARYEGSFFGLRARLEPLAGGADPEPVIVYLPGVARDPKESILMEFELAGELYQPQLKRLAPHVLKKLFNEGQVDKLLRAEKITYDDIVSFLRQGEEDRSASVLRGLFRGLKSEPLLARWLADDQQDQAIADKEATPELLQLIQARLGLELPATTSLTTAREKTSRYVLINEFRSDLTGKPPSLVSMVPEPTTDKERKYVREVAQLLRGKESDRYEALADRVESDLGLTDAAIEPRHLGSIDTFRFEEKRLLTHAGEMVVASEYAAALEIVTGRRRSFWVDRDVLRQRQWEICRLMAELGQSVATVGSALSKANKDPAKWVSAYTAEGGWHEVDKAQRALEVAVATLDEEPENEKALALVRREHEDLLRKMAEGFSHALEQAGWNVPGIAPQTRIWPDFVESRGEKVAYFLVDALRYEMGLELARKLPSAKNLDVRPAIAALPTITPVGMAALLPGAASSFSVIDHKGKLAAEVDATPLQDWAQRWKYLKSRVPDVVEMRLGHLLSQPARQLAKDVAKAPVVVIRSQEIDFSGETSLLPWQVMEITIGNLARAVKKLAAAGIEKCIITADHGHQFAIRKEEDMRTDKPGGDCVGVHRRCWIGRGGSTPTGTTRVSGADLGYRTDLDFIFPKGLGVFKTGGGLAYHHGGTSLQELVVPVVSLRMAAPAAATSKRENVRLEGIPDRLTNRTFGVKIFVEGDLFSQEPVPLRVVLVAGGEQVGAAGMAFDAELDSSTGILTVKPRTEASVGMILQRDDCKALRVVVQDPTTDAVLAESEAIPVSLGI